ncbi:hypothetical protein [Streptomyces sp. NPDC058394]|uniref:hypothetical protein n=1 Tax=Streptomyces sp. NPDC058394 TaxID=3346477 RepID=UPI0036533929
MATDAHTGNTADLDDLQSWVKKLVDATEHFDAQRQKKQRKEAERILANPEIDPQVQRVKEQNRTWAKWKSEAISKPDNSRPVDPSANQGASAGSPEMAAAASRRISVSDSAQRKTPLQSAESSAAPALTAAPVRARKAR